MISGYDEIIIAERKRVFKQQPEIDLLNNYKNVLSLNEAYRNLLKAD